MGRTFGQNVLSYVWLTLLTVFTLFFEDISTADHGEAWWQKGYTDHG